jgi:RNA polymerase sigma factor (sigma-70 family)
MKEIYETYYTQLIYFGLKILKNNQPVVEDIVIDCILAFIDKGYARRLANGILYACVKNKCLNYLRSNKAHERIVSREFDEEYYEMQVLESRLIQLLNDAIHTLPADEKTVVIMYYLEEKTCVQIAALLNKTPATVRSLKRHGLNKLVNLNHLRR